MVLLVFLHGTVIMHSGGIAHTRAGRVAQSRERAGHGLLDFSTYVPIGDAVARLTRWRDEGATIAYLSSHQSEADVNKDAHVLAQHGFPDGEIVFRRSGQNYGDVVQGVMPDVLIEDDCESIGAGEIAYSQLLPEAKDRIRSVIVPEFGGIDHLPDSLFDLLRASDI